MKKSLILIVLSLVVCVTCVACAGMFANEYTVKFDTDGGTSIEAVTVAKGEALSEPEAPTKEGYVFEGWYLDEELYDFETPVSSNITLKAKWNVNKHTLSFNSNGGSTVASVEVEWGKNATAPANPTRKGYTFGGWYLGEEEFNFEEPIKANITLTAKWNANKYQLSFGEEIGSIEVTYGQAIGTLPGISEQPGKVGAWCIGDVAISSDMIWNYSSDQSATLVYEDIVYNVTFVNGNELLSSFEVVHGKKISAPAVEMTGYTVTWLLPTGEAYDFDTSVTQNLQLELNATANTYVLSFGTGADSINVTYGQPIGELPVFPNLKEGSVGAWIVDGIEISAETEWSFADNKTATANYIIDKTSTMIDISTFGDVDVALQIQNSGLIDGFDETEIVSVFNSDTNEELTSSFLSSVEENATDEASRTFLLTLKTTDTVYKVKVFCATKVLMTIQDLRDMRHGLFEYEDLDNDGIGNLVSYKILNNSAGMNLTVYTSNYNGYYVLGANITAENPGQANTTILSGCNNRYSSMVGTATDQYLSIYSNIVTYNGTNYTINDKQTYTNLPENFGFTGTFDGRGYELKGFCYNGGGLFGDVYGATIKNVAFTDCVIATGNSVRSSGVVGRLASGFTMENVYIDIDMCCEVYESALAEKVYKTITLKNCVIEMVSHWNPSNANHVSRLTTHSAWGAIILNNVYFISEEIVGGVEGGTGTRSDKEITLVNNASQIPSTNTYVSIMPEEVATTRFVGLDENYFTVEEGKAPVWKTK